MAKHSVYLISDTSRVFGSKALINQFCQNDLVHGTHKQTAHLLLDAPLL